MQKRTVDNENLPREIAARNRYSLGVRAGNTLWISGQVAFRDGVIIGEGDIRAQAEQVFVNIGEVLSAAGAGFDDLVETTTYLVDRDHNPIVGEVRARHITGPVPPTSTVVVVAGLARPEVLLEISAVAVLDD